MNTVTINGVTYSGSSSVIVTGDGTVIIDGKRADKHSTVERLRMRIEGHIQNIEVHGDVTCDNIAGDVSAGGSVRCGNIGGSINAGGSVQASGRIGQGSINAGGSVRIG